MINGQWTGSPTPNQHDILTGSNADGTLIPGKTCSDWTCASTELLLANGDPQVIALPVAMNDARWLIVRRFTAGSAIDVSTDPFHVEQFDGMTRVVARLNELTPGHRPMILTAPDGQMLIISLKEPEPRRRAVGH